MGSLRGRPDSSLRILSNKQSDLQHVSAMSLRSALGLVNCHSTRENKAAKYKRSATLRE
jgi:hypothetical protein